MKLPGNRASEVLTSEWSGAGTYNYPSGNNLLSTITQDSNTVRSFASDSADNMSADTHGRLAELTISSTATAD